MAVKIVFLFADNAEAEEGGGDVRVVVSGPRAGDTATWSPVLTPDPGELSEKLVEAGPTEQGMLSTGGNTDESDICGTLTVLTEGRREAATEAAEAEAEAWSPG